MIDKEKSWVALKKKLEKYFRVLFVFILVYCPQPVTKPHMTKITWRPLNNLFLENKIWVEI